jgi:hypothetical protein
MSIMIKRTGSEVQVLAGAESLPEGEAVQLYTAAEASALQAERIAWLELQMPSFFRGEEDQAAADLFDL